MSDHTPSSDAASAEAAPTEATSAEVTSAEVRITKAPLGGESPQSGEQGVARRTIVKGAAWSIPVIALAVATPLAAASTQPILACPVISYYWGDSEGATVRNAQFISNTQHRWVAGTTGTVTVGLGNAAAGGNPGFSISTPVPLNVTLNQLAYTYTLPYQVNWTSIGSGWTLASSTVVAGQYVYRFTYSLTPTTVVSSNTAPGTVIVPKATATGAMVVPNNTILENAYTSYNARVDAIYTPDFLGQYNNCTSANGNDGVARVRTQNFTRPLVWAF